MTPDAPPDPLAPFADDGSRAGLAELWAVLRPVRGVLLLGAALAVLGTAASLLQPLLLSRLVDAATTGGSLAGPLAVLSAVFVLDAVLVGLQSYVLLRGGESLALAVRERMVRRIVSWRPGVRSDRRAGDLVARVGTDVAGLRAVVGEGVVDVLGAVLSLAGAVVLMVTLDPVLFAVSIGVLALSAVCVVGFLTRIRTATEVAQQEVGVMSADLDRALSGLPTVVTAGMLDAERQRITARAAAACAAGRRAAAWDALVAPVLLTGANAALLVVFGVGAVRVAEGATDLGAFVSFLLYSAVLVTPVLVSFQAVTTVQRGLASLRRVQEVLDEPAGTPAAAGGARLPGGPLAVDVDGVTFAHPGTRGPVLSGLDLRLAPATVTAVTGPSGQGKTTLLSLLVGLEHPGAGTVRLGGVPLGQVAEADLRGAVAYVQQDAPLFWGTLRDNLTYGVRDCSDDDLAGVVDRLGLGPLVRALPAGLDSEVGDGGVLLSGGERQRIAVARAVLRRPRLLVLDEPTAQLDAAAESAVLAELARIRPRCTVVLSSHRASTIRATDAVVDLAAHPAVPASPGGPPGD